MLECYYRTRFIEDVDSSKRGKSSVKSCPARIDKVTEKSYTAFAANLCLFYRNRVVAIVGMLVEEKFPWNNQPC